ncbi:hypothetical protein BDV93DRAFT_525370 [Ceratobasidium sp. AG-I]|nr:hypothetical protein BDV93DRAFT_525370 [Ceratobasidium sp. AG-I]
MRHIKNTTPISKGAELSPYWIAWIALCVITLGFPAKYRERLRLFESLAPPNESIPWSTPPEYSDRGPKHKDRDSQRTMREKQQEEWDRLNIAVSVITATSAAALAIQATSDKTEVYWLVTAFYSTAFGLSLQGLISITHMTIVAGGSSDEAIGRFANGTLMSKRRMSVRPVAFMMALPAILATYSSISLLAGLVVMVLAGPGPGIQLKSAPYIRVTMIPVSIAFVFLCVSIAMCEIGSWVEIRGRRLYLAANENKYRTATPPTSRVESAMFEKDDIEPSNIGQLPELTRNS